MIGESINVLDAKCALLRGHDEVQKATIGTEMAEAQRAHGFGSLLISMLANERLVLGDHCGTIQVRSRIVTRSLVITLAESRHGRLAIGLRLSPGRKQT